MIIIQKKTYLFLLVFMFPLLVFAQRPTVNDMNKNSGSFDNGTTLQLDEIVISAERVVDTVPNYAQSITNGLKSDTLRFIYTSDRGPHWALWRKIPGYAEPVFTKEKMATWGARVSPSGKKILYYKGYAKKMNTVFENVSLWTMNLDGSEQTEIISAGENDWISHSDANWSPNGKRIVMVATKYEEEGPQIIMVDVNGDKPRIVTTRNGGYMNPYFSPDGKQIVCSAYPEGVKQNSYNHTEIFIINIRDGEETQLTSDDYADANPNWSPNGKLIVFDSTPKLLDASKAKPIIRIVPVDQSEEVSVVLSDENRNSKPRFLADSQVIFFERVPYMSSMTQLCTMSIWEKMVFPVTSSKVNHFDAAVLPPIND